MNIQQIYGLIFKVWRKRRHQWFLDRIKPKELDRLIDVGGYAGTWASNPIPVAEIVTINVDCPSPGRSGNIISKAGDARRLEAGDGEFEIGYSNSVIEHVGTWEDQKAFANEIRRVARRLWVQTPAHGCPIEPHYLFPFIHYLPKSWRRRLAPFTLWGLISRPSPELIEEYVETIRLLKLSEMKQLFPDCEILTERLLFVFPKSYVAIRKWRSDGLKSR